MTIGDKFTPPQNVIAREVGDEAVLLDLTSGMYFGLDPVGAQMWRLIAGGCTLGEVCDKMIEEYDVAREDIERDLLALVRDLTEKKLLLRS